MEPLAEGMAAVGDPYIVGVHLVFLGTVVLGFVLLLGMIVLFIAVLLLAGVVQLVVLAVRALFRVVVPGRRGRLRPLRRGQPAQQARAVGSGSPRERPVTGIPADEMSRRALPSTPASNLRPLG